MEQKSPRRIVVADDNEDSAESFAMLLSFSGHEVRVAHDAGGTRRALGSRSDLDRGDRLGSAGRSHARTHGGLRPAPRQAHRSGGSRPVAGRLNGCWTPERQWTANITEAATTAVRPNRMAAMFAKLRVMKVIGDSGS
jgi:hypothetical protein